MSVREFRLTFPGTARFAVALSAALGLLMFATGTAYAGVASVEGPVISFKAQPGEVNDVQAVPSSVGVLFADASSPLDAGDGCTTEADGVFCAFPEPISDEKVVELRLRDGNDSARFDDRAGTVTDQRIFGGRGDDTIFAGGTSPNRVLEDGGPGDDDLSSAMNFSGSATLRGGAGKDGLSAIENAEVHMDGGSDADSLKVGGPLGFPGGDHSFDAGKGNDTISFSFGDDGEFLPEVSAGRGFDTISFANALPSGGVSLDFNSCPACSVERVIGSPFADTLTGDASSMRFDAGAGDDTIDPGGGFDTVFAGDGNDQVNTVDRGFDLASCGADQDTATGDRRDLFFGDCETVTRAAGRSAAP